MTLRDIWHHWCWLRQIKKGRKIRERPPTPFDSSKAFKVGDLVYHHECGKSEVLIAPYWGPCFQHWVVILKKKSNQEACLVLLKHVSAIHGIRWQEVGF